MPISLLKGITQLEAVVNLKLTRLTETMVMLSRHPVVEHCNVRSTLIAFLMSCQCTLLAYLLRKAGSVGVANNMVSIMTHIRLVGCQEAKQ